MTVVPPVVQPSLGQIALIDGVAAEHKNPATSDHVECSPRDPYSGYIIYKFIHHHMVAKKIK